MIVWLNGDFLPADQARVSVFDRSFLYGDGLFETIRVCEGQPILWDRHLQRLRAGARTLDMPPWEPADTPLLDLATELLRRNAAAHAVLRIHLSRGPGQRGYSPRGARHPTLLISVHPAPPLDADPPPPWRLRTASIRLPARDPLGCFKTASKLAHIMARAEAEAAGADEALLLNTSGHIAEAAAANVFWIEDKVLCTPALAEGGLEGVTRGLVIELFCHQGWSVQETARGPEALVNAAGVFLTVTTYGLIEGVELDGTPLRRHPQVPAWRRWYREAIRRAGGASPRQRAGIGPGVD